MQTEVKTRIRKLRGGGSEIVMEILLVPRGSGNRTMARNLAAAFKKHPDLAEHVRKTVAGTSKVTVHLIASAALMKTILTWDGKPAGDVPGQLPLFDGLMAGMMGKAARPA
jgi:hypothetical protein